MQDGENTQGVPSGQFDWQQSFANQAPAAAPSDAFQMSWTASEFIAHTKSLGWYGLLGLITVVVTAGVYLLTKDMVISGVLLFVAIMFGLIAARQPRELAYKVDSHGVQVGEKFYPYGSFRSFSIVQEEGIESIWFMPLQRFMPGLSIYFAPPDADKISEIISNFLPFEPKDADPLDRLMHRLRF